MHSETKDKIRIFYIKVALFFLPSERSFPSAGEECLGLKHCRSFKGLLLNLDIKNVS